MSNNFPEMKYQPIASPPEDETIPDDVPIQELAEQVVRGKRRLSPAQMRMLIELLPFYMPKLSSVGVGLLNANDFAARLERAVNRSERAKLIEGHAIRDE
jgi:hypothetical protein